VSGWQNQATDKYPHPCKEYQKHFTYLGRILKGIREEVTGRLNSRSASHHSLQNPMRSRFLQKKNIKITI